MGQEEAGKGRKRGLLTVWIVRKSQGWFRALLLALRDVPGTAFPRLPLAGSESCGQQHPWEVCPPLEAEVSMCCCSRALQQQRGREGQLVDPLGNPFGPTLTRRDTPRAPWHGRGRGARLLTNRGSLIPISAGKPSPRTLQGELCPLGQEEERSKGLLWAGIAWSLPGHLPLHGSWLQVLS